MYQPCLDANGCTTTRCRALAVFDNIIYGFFLIEMVIKLIAMGLIGKQSYLAETWNRLDFFIIIAGCDGESLYIFTVLRSLLFEPFRDVPEPRLASCLYHIIYCFIRIVSCCLPGHQTSSTLY